MFCLCCNWAIVVVVAIEITTNARISFFIDFFKDRETRKRSAGMFDTVYWVLKWCYHSYTSDKILGCTQYAPISFPLFQLHNFLLPIKQFLRKLWLIRFTKKSCNRFQCSTELQKCFLSLKLIWFEKGECFFKVVSATLVVIQIYWHPQQIKPSLNIYSEIVCSYLD